MSSSIFFGDPTHPQTSNIVVSENHTLPLKGRNWLSTTLIDYFLQNWIPKSFIKKNVIITSTEMISNMELMLSKINDDNAKVKKSVDIIRNRYVKLQNGLHHIYSLVCFEDHFF
jgi:hypothetical protein